MKPILLSCCTGNKPKSLVFAYDFPDLQESVAGATTFEVSVMHL